MNSIDEKNNEILANALSNAAKINNKDFPDDIEDDISLKLIKKIAEIEISKIEYDFNIFSRFKATDLDIFIPILGILLAVFGIGLSEIILGINLFSLTKDISSFSWYYITGGIIIICVGIAIAYIVMLLQIKVYKRKLERFNFFQRIILKIERRLLKKF